MFSGYSRWLISALWVAVTLLTFFFVGASSARSWLYLVAGMVVPPIIILTLWNDGPPLTVAEILRGAEERR